MVTQIQAASTEPRTAELQQVTALLGGPEALGHALRTPLDVHELLLKGMPGGALRGLLRKMVILKQAQLLEKGVGISLRSFQRQKADPRRSLSPEVSGRTWKFAEILAKATSVLGSQKEAELWLEQPAIALDQRRPIDLLATPAGVELVEDLLERIEYGVYT